MSSSQDCDPSWRDEAEAVMKDIKRHVHKISVSDLPSSNKIIFFNVTTLEKKDFCVELTPAGFRVVGEKYDSEKKRGKYSYFETPYSLLNSLSSAYRCSFEQELYHKLNKLQKEREAESEEVEETKSTKLTESKEKKEAEEAEEEEEEGEKEAAQEGK